MKRLAISVFLCLALATVAATAQESDTKSTKKAKSAPADCSTASDAAITASVRERLAKAPSLKNATIDVETKEGVVTLKGTVKTGGIKGVATRMTKRVDCVKKVDNQLGVEQSSKKLTKADG